MTQTVPDKELDRIANTPGSMIFALLVGMIVDYEQTQLADDTAKSRMKRNRAQMALITAAEHRIRKLVQIDLMDELIAHFEGVEGLDATKPASLEDAPITYQLRLMRMEIGQ